MTGPRAGDPELGDGAGATRDAPATDHGPTHGPTPMRGVWVAVAIIGGAALVFLVLALTSGALSL